MENQGRLVLFLVLSMLILFASSYFMPTPPPPVPKAATTQANPIKETPSLSTNKVVVKKATKIPAGAKIPQMQETSVTIETDDYIATFSNRGAVLEGFQLKKYLNRQTHRPIQLVNPDPDRPKPFSIEYSPLPTVNQTLFQIEGSSKRLAKTDEKAVLVFRTANGQGLVLQKTFSFKNSSYLIDFDMAVNQTSRTQVAASDLVVEWPDTLGPEENTGGTSSRTGGYRVATFASGQFDSQNVKKTQDINQISSPVAWTALANQFFVAAMIPDPSSGGASAKIIRDYNAYKPPSDENPNPGIDSKFFDPRPLLVFSGQNLQSGESFERKGEVYFGPQDYSLLKSLHLGLEKVVDFGMFGFISVYMLDLLKWFFTWCRNWGLAILLLSIAVKLILWFPTQSSYKNMYLMSQKTREIQPKLEAIKRKYADDKQKQQQETMALYQQAGINPLGGCLPMLLQTPVFIALYSTLSHSIELRGAPFLWIGDLTLKDPIYLLPLLMGASMIFSQRMSGQMTTQAAGQQKMMMWMMPVMLTFFSFQWPSGLLVYWVVTNILSMIQQKVVNIEVQKAKKKAEA